MSALPLKTIDSRLSTSIIPLQSKENSDSIFRRDRTIQNFFESQVSTRLKCQNSISRFNSNVFWNSLLRPIPKICFEKGSNEFVSLFFDSEKSFKLLESPDTKCAAYVDIIVSKRDKTAIDRIIASVSSLEYAGYNLPIDSQASHVNFNSTHSNSSFDQLIDYGDESKMSNFDILHKFVTIQNQSLRTLDKESIVDLFPTRIDHLPVLIEDFDTTIKTRIMSLVSNNVNEIQSFVNLEQKQDYSGNTVLEHISINSFNQDVKNLNILNVQYHNSIENIIIQKSGIFSPNDQPRTISLPVLTSTHLSYQTVNPMHNQEVRLTNNPLNLVDPVNIVNEFHFSSEIL